MTRGNSPSPGWVAVAVAAALAAAAALRYVRPPGEPPPAAESRSSDDAGAPVPLWPAARAGEGPPSTSDPFRGGDGAAQRPDDGSAPSESGSDPSEAQPLPRIAGVGQRADGVAFVGCALPGEGTTIVREGSYCGAFRLLEVVDDSARFANDASGSVITLGVGEWR